MKPRVHGDSWLDFFCELPPWMVSSALLAGALVCFEIADKVEQAAIRDRLDAIEARLDAGACAP